MAKNTWIITDLSMDVQHRDMTLSEVELGIRGASVKVHTLQGGHCEGVQTITVTTPKCKFVVLPTRGMNIWKAWSGETEYGWKSPARGPVHPNFVPLMEPGGLGWLDGFDELFVRCGLESNGAPEHDEAGNLRYPLHGRISNKPAHSVRIDADDSTGEISLVGEVDESRFHFLKLRLTARATIKSGTSSIQINDTVKNLSASEAEVQLLYHINFGDPLLDGGSQFSAPVKTIVPRNDHAASSLKSWQHYQAPTAGVEEQVYFLKLLGDKEGNSQSLLKNAHSSAGVNIGFNLKQLPVYSLWKNPTALEDGYVTGLEPGTNFPNPRSYEGEQGRVVKLAGGEDFPFQLTLDLLTNSNAIQSAEKAIAALQGDTEPEIFDRPQPGWCADA